MPRRSGIAAASPSIAARAVSILDLSTAGQPSSPVTLGAWVVRVITPRNARLMKNAQASKFVTAVAADRVTAIASMASGDALPIVVVACALSRIQVVAQVRTRRAVKATPIAVRVLPVTVTLVRHRYAPVLAAMRGHVPSTVVADDVSLSKAFVRVFLRQAGALSLPVRTVSVALFRLVVVLGVHAFASKRVGSARKTAAVVASANRSSLLAG